MKALISIGLLFLGFAVNAQIKTGTVVNPDGSKSPTFTVALSKPKTTTSSLTSEVKFQYPEGLFPEPIAYKKGANGNTYVLVANESSTEVSQFVIDIFAGNKNLSKATLLVKLSATSFDKLKLGNGTYKFSDKNASERLKYEFSGAVKLGDVDVPVCAGEFTVSRTEKHIELNYNLTLANGVTTIGQYNTDYQVEDRRGLAVK